MQCLSSIAFLSVVASAAGASGDAPDGVPDLLRRLSPDELRAPLYADTDDIEIMRSRALVQLVDSTRPTVDAAGSARGHGLAIGWTGNLSDISLRLLSTETVRIHEAWIPSRLDGRLPGIGPVGPSGFKRATPGTPQRRYGKPARR